MGTKQKKIVSAGGNTEYAGNYVYENSSLKFFNQAEGYVEPNGSDWDYVYQYKDHLGNIRLSYGDANGDGSITTSEIREENNYYPFGLKQKGYNTAQNGADHKYGFGGKEEQDELGLQWIDITARNYDPALGRWMNLDPLAEDMRRFSPYTFAFNNPIYFIDPDGMMPFGLGGLDDSDNFDKLDESSLDDEFSRRMNAKGQEDFGNGFRPMYKAGRETGNGNGDDCCGVSSTDNGDGTTTLSSNGLNFTTNTLSLEGASDSRSPLERNTKTFLGIAGRGFGLGAMGLSYAPELAKAGEIGFLGSKFLRTFGRIGGGVSIGLDYFAYKDGSISKSQFQMNSTWTTYGLIGGPFGFLASSAYFVMGDLLGGHQRAKENFDRWQSYTPEQKREAISRSLDNKHGGGKLRNPKF